MGVGLSGVLSRGRPIYFFLPFASSLSSFLSFHIDFLTALADWTPAHRQHRGDENAKKKAVQVEEGRQAEAARLKEKVAEVMSLQEVLLKEEQTSTDLKTALEEERRKVEAEVSKLKE